MISSRFSRHLVSRPVTSHQLRSSSLRRMTNNSSPQEVLKEALFGRYETVIVNVIVLSLGISAYEIAKEEPSFLGPKETFYDKASLTFRFTSMAIGTTIIWPVSIVMGLATVVKIYSSRTED